eukprot:g18412.t1
MSPPKGVPTNRRDSHSRFDEHRHNGSDRPLQKKRLGNDTGISTGAGGGGGGGGPVKIWRCPSTSSLREEACADLKGMDRPGLWRGPRQSSEELKAGYDQLHRLKERFKADRKRRVAGVKGGFLSHLRAELSEDERERWMKRRAFVRPDRFTVGQRRELREWFDCLDKDGSGEIDSSELSHPLLCTGLARSALEVGHLVRQVDKDGSGEIGFKEFLAILRPKGSSAGKSAIDKIVHLQDVKRAHGSDMQTVVATARRSLLIKEVLDEAAFRSSVTDDVEKQRLLALSNGDMRALKALREREERLERRRVKKNLFIQAVSDATDFQQERKRIDEAVLQNVRMRELRKKKRALALTVHSLSPSSWRHPAPSSTEPVYAPAFAPSPTPSVRFAEPELASADHHNNCGTNNKNARASAESGQTGTAGTCCRSGSGSSGGVSGDGASAFATFASSPEVQKLLWQDEHHLMQRRRHHHNFKRSASARNLEGTDGMICLSGSPPGSRGCGLGLAGNDDECALPVSVTASVMVYSGGNMEACTTSSLPLSGKSAASAFPAAEIPSEQASRLGPPLRGDARITGHRSREGSRSRPFSYGNDTSNNTSSNRAGKYSPARISGSHARRSNGCSVGGANGAQGPDKISRSRDGASEVADHPLPPTTREGCRAVDDIHGLTEGTARAGFSAEGGLTLTGTGKSRVEEGSRPMVDQADVVADEVSVGRTGEGPGSLVARCATDWYRQSKLSASVNGAARLPLGTGQASKAHSQIVVGGGGGDTARVDDNKFLE